LSGVHRRTDEDDPTVWTDIDKGADLPNLRSGHRPRRFFGIPTTAAIEAHVLKDHHACLQVNRRFGPKAALATLTALHISCPL
jgi:hypothetical protein